MIKKGVRHLPCKLTVEIRFIFDLGVKETVRMDTGEIVHTERMTDDERQMEMEFSDEQDGRQMEMEFSKGNRKPQKSHQKRLD